jgi:hypothetical protein
MSKGPAMSGPEIHLGSEFPPYCRPEEPAPPRATLVTRTASRLRAFGVTSIALDLADIAAPKVSVQVGGRTHTATAPSLENAIAALPDLIDSEQLRG